MKPTPSFYGVDPVAAGTTRLDPVFHRKWHRRRFNQTLDDYSNHIGRLKAILEVECLFLTLGRAWL
jgi:hypothetical protein